jgi:hypothetical protein
MAITAADELLHPVEDPSEHWSDSLYFNAWDPASGTFLLTRMAVMPNRPGADALFLVWLGGQPVYIYYQSVDALPAGDWPAMAIGGLRYTMARSLRDWSIELADGDDLASLSWRGFTGVFDYADNPQPLPRAIAWGHYEQTGHVTGRLSLAGREVAFDGVGQRDHSWGHRHWAGVREWHWVTGFFPDGGPRSFNLFHAVAADGTVTANGFVHDAGRDLAVVAASRSTTEGDGRSPEDYRLVLTVADGSTFSVAGRRSGTGMALQPAATTVHEVPMALSAGDGLTGFGVYELLVNAP